MLDAEPGPGWIPFCCTDATDHLFLCNIFANTLLTCCYHVCWYAPMLTHAYLLYPGSCECVLWSFGYPMRMALCACVNTPRPPISKDLKRKKQKAQLCFWYSGYCNKLDSLWFCTPEESLVLCRIFQTCSLRECEKCFPVLFFSGQSHSFEAGNSGWVIANWKEPNLVTESPEQPSAYYFFNPDVLSWLFCVKIKGLILTFHYAVLFSSHFYWGLNDWLVVKMLGMSSRGQHLGRFLQALKWWEVKTLPVEWGVVYS